MAASSKNPLELSRHDQVVRLFPWDFVLLFLKETRFNPKVSGLTDREISILGYLNKVTSSTPYFGISFTPNLGIYQSAVSLEFSSDTGGIRLPGFRSINRDFMIQGAHLDDISDK